MLHAAELTPECIGFDEDSKLLYYGIGLTNVVARPTRSSAELKRCEMKEGAAVVEEKLRRFKPKIAVFNGKCIYEEFANKKNRKSQFNFGLQPEQIGDTALWVVPSSSARCTQFPRMSDKLCFYQALKKYLSYLKGEVDEINYKEFQFDGKCKAPVPTTSKMWRRKKLSAFVHGGRISNSQICWDTLDSVITRSSYFAIVENEETEKKADCIDSHLETEKCVECTTSYSHKEALEKCQLDDYECLDEDIVKGIINIPKHRRNIPKL